MLYLSGYIAVAGQIEDMDDRDNIENEKERQPILGIPNKHFLLQPPGENNGNVLPGAVVLDSKKFEISEGKEATKRNANVLPGAIDLEGKFDEGNEVLPGVGSPSTGSPTDRKDGPKYGSKSDKDSKEGSVSKSGKTKKSKSSKKKIKKKKSTSSSTFKKSTKKSDSDAKPNAQEKGTKGHSSTKTTQNASKDKKSADNSAEGGKSGDDTDVLETSKSKGTTKNEPQATSSGPLYTGPHPMNRNMEELQVPGESALDDASVRSHYEKLVKAYLAPFSNGITRRSFFEILRRRTYSLAPPGSNKGIQTLLFQLLDKSKLGIQRRSIWSHLL